MTVGGEGHELWFIGAQRQTIMNGKLAAALDLRTLADRPHLYGLGPLEQLRGDATIADSRPALARVGPDGMVKVTQSFDNPFIGRRRRPGPGAVIEGGEWVLETTTVRWMKQPVICIAPFATRDFRQSGGEWDVWPGEARPRGGTSSHAAQGGL